MLAVRVFHRLSFVLLAICLLVASVSAADPPITPVAKSSSAGDETELDKFFRDMLSSTAYRLYDRKTAAVFLLKRGGPEGIKQVITVLENNEDSQGQLAVAEALVEVKLDHRPPAFVELLIVALSAEDENLRQAAAVAVADYKLEVLDQLSGIILQLDPATTETTQMAAVAAVERIQDKKSAQILIQALDDENPLVSARCRQGLEKLTGIPRGDDNDAWRKWWEQNKDKKLDVWKDLFIAALIDQNRELRSEIKQLRDQLRNQIQVRWTRAQDKGKFLRELLANPLENVRLQAMDLARDLPIGTFPDQLRIDIRKLLTDSSSPVRALAAELLRDLRDTQSAIIFLDRLSQETDHPEVRASFAEALGYIGGVKAVEPLIGLLADPDPLVVGKAASALGNLASADDVGPLKDSVVQALLDQYQKTSPTTNGADARLRSDILSAMGKVGSSSFRPHFLQALNDDSPLSRIAALEGLRSLPPNGHSKETLDAILSLLVDNDRGVRLEVVTSLDYLADLGALKALGKRLDPNVEPDVYVRDEVWRVITNLLDKADLDTLDDWERKAVVVDVPERHEQVLGILESKLAEDQSNSVRLIEVREKLGDYRESLKGWEAAAEKYRLAYEQAKTIFDQSISQTRDGLALKLLKALLNQGDFDKAVEHLNAITAAYPSLDGKALNLTLEYLQSRLEPPVVPKNIVTALELISVLEKAHLSGLARPPLSDTYSNLKAEVEALDLRRNSDKDPGTS